MESLSLIDAVMPDVVASRQQQLQNIQKAPDVKKETTSSNGEEPMCTLRESKQTLIIARFE